MSRPRYSVDLRAHIAECDANYARLMRLLPRLEHEDARALQLPLPDDSTRRMVFRVLERCPYTTVLEVGFVAENGRDEPHAWHPMLPAPSFTVRLYHDARTAEVTEYQARRSFQGRYRYPNAEMRHPDEKSQLNRFLAEYLAHCLQHGCAVDDVCPAGTTP